jgi:hypothetical protein
MRATPAQGLERLAARRVGRGERLGLVLYGALCSGATAFCFVFFAAWISNVLLPVTIDSGSPGPVASSLALDAVLLVAFCLLHSAGARTRLKRILRRRIPHEIERASYCLVFSVLLAALCLVWQPVPALVWQVENPVGVAALHGLFALAWAIHLLGIALIDHIEFFGLRQIGFAVRGESYRPLPPVPRRRYVLTHVPVVVGLALVPWATPSMSLGRLLFAVLATLYCALGAWWSDRDPGDATGQA